MSTELHDKTSVWIDPTSTPEENVADIAKYSAEDLATVLVNKELNDLIVSRTGGLFAADRGPMAFQGWYWRAVDFFDAKAVDIADGDGHVAICQNNKWDYADRCLTDDELKTFRGHVWDAYKASRVGGSLKEINDNVDNRLEAASSYIASLDVPDNRSW